MFCPLCPLVTQANLTGSGFTVTMLTAHIKGTHIVTGRHCELCQQAFKTNSALISHLASKKHFKCQHCKQDFMSNDGLVSHIAAKHKCKAPKCPLTFKTYAELNKHTELCHNGGSNGTLASTSDAETTIPVTFPCASCGADFASLPMLQQHTNVIHGKWEHPSFSSDTSNETFTSHHYASSSDSSPSKVVSKANIPFRCPTCQQPFSSVNELSFHTRDIHVAKKFYPCGICSQTFSKKKKHATHRVTAHPTAPICAICGLTCLSQQVLNDHFNAVHPTCAECNESFEDDAAYATHRQMTHPEPSRVASPSSYSCPFCNRIFKFRLSLDDHKAAKHPVICGMCNFTCPQEDILQDHIASAHSCPICHEGVFANADILDEHLLDHATPYRCEVCQTRYAEEEDLWQHYRDSPDDIHPSCTRCGLGCLDAADHYNHKETVHPQISCQLCDGALFDPGELSTHYLVSRNHPVCDICQVGFSDQDEFAMHGATEHPEAYCHICQWQFESTESLQNHIRHFAAHPRCLDCDLRFADADVYQDHLFIVHRPHCGKPATREDFDPDFRDDNRVGPTRSISGNPELPYEFIPLPPSTSGYSSPVSQRVPTGSSVGSRSSSRTISPSTVRSIKFTHMENGHPLDRSSSPEFEHSPLSNVPAVGTPLTSNTDLYSPFSPSPESQALFAPSEQLDDGSFSDQESVASAKSPETSSPVIKLPEDDASPISSSGWSILSGDIIGPKMTAKSDNSRPVNLAVPMVRLQRSASDGVSQTVSISLSPSSISPESAAIDISVNVTPDYLREARAYLAVTHPEQASSTVNNVHSPSRASPNFSTLTASSRERRREVRFEDSIMSEPMWDDQSSESSGSSFDPPVMQNRRKYGVLKKPAAASKLPRFASLRASRITGRNGHNHSASSASSLSPYHCRICGREPCEDLTTTTCGHLFCNGCITDAVIRDSRCPVCSNAVLLYCLFRIDTT